jgi:ABC-type tungstate transport system permease subunit
MIFTSLHLALSHRGFNRAVLKLTIGSCIVNTTAILTIGHYGDVQISWPRVLGKLCRSALFFPSTLIRLFL